MCMIGFKIILAHYFLPKHKGKYEPIDLYACVDWCVA